MRILNISNKNLTKKEIINLKERGYNKIISLPDKLKKIWREIPNDTDIKSIKEHIHPIVNYATNYDAILLEGEITASIIIAEKLSLIGTKVLVPSSENFFREV